MSGVPDFDLFVSYVFCLGSCFVAVLFDWLCWLLCYGCVFVCL